MKLAGKWVSMSPEKARKLKIPTEEGRWYIQWRLGKKKEYLQVLNWGHAITAKGKKEAELAAIAVGVDMPAPKAKRLKFEEAIEDFYEDLKLRDRRSETVEAYRLVFDNFRPTFKKTYLDEIDRRDLLRFADSMCKAGLSPRTVSNRWLAFHSFLKHFEITRITKRGDAPKFVEEEPEAYTQAEMTTFFAACNPYQRLLFQFYLKTGARMQEVRSCEWADLNFATRQFKIQAKPEHDFRPKGWEERSIPLEEGLALALEARRKAFPKGKLVFPTKSGNLNGKMLEACKRIAKRAGLKKEEFFLHKFRSTFATWHADAGVPVQVIQKWMGHKNIETTIRYIRPNRSVAITEKFNATFKGI